MAIYVLSARGIVSSVSNDPLFELEDIFADTCEAQILAPTANAIARRVHHQSDLIAKAIHRTLRQTGNFYEKISLDLPRELNVLILVALHGDRLKILSSLPQWRKQFDVVVAYVFDSWLLETYPDYTRDLDCLFVPMPEVVETLKQHLNIPVFVLPFAADALNHGSDIVERKIDLVSYGRIPQPHHQAFSAAFHVPESQWLYWRPVPRTTENFPQLPYEQRVDREHTLQLYQMLRSAKLALAYDTMYPGMRQFPYPFVTLRWFQCGAAGCAIVGKRPSTPLADELLDWEEATIELPDDPQSCVSFIKELLADQSRLAVIHRRNAFHHLMRHDWRHRIQRMFSILGLPLPEPLKQQLNLIQQRCAPRSLLERALTH